MHVLLIDDDPDIRLLAGFVLEAAGHRVTFATSGRDGIVAAGGGFDLVVLDFRLGDMTGLDVLPALRVANPARPVVFLTGADEPAQTAALAAAGAAAVIAKPFDPDTLVPRLEAILTSSRADARS